MKVTRGSSWEGFKTRGETDGEDVEQQAVRVPRTREGSATPAPTPAPDGPETNPETSDSLKKEPEQAVAPPSRASGGNQPLFDALLMAATGLSVRIWHYEKSLGAHDCTFLLSQHHAMQSSSNILIACIF